MNSNASSTLFEFTSPSDVTSNLPVVVKSRLQASIYTTSIHFTPLALSKIVKEDFTCFVAIAPVSSGRYDIFDSFYILVLYPQCFPEILEAAQDVLKDLHATQCDMFFNSIDFQKSFWCNTSKSYSSMLREMKDDFQPDVLHLILKDYNCIEININIANTVVQVINRDLKRAYAKACTVEYQRKQSLKEVQKLEAKL